MQFAWVLMTGCALQVAEEFIASERNEGEGAIRLPRGETKRKSGRSHKEWIFSPRDSEYAHGGTRSNFG